MQVVRVQNENTGEEECVFCSMDGEDAQIEALVHCFQTKGWRKSVAHKPEEHMSDAGTGIASQS